MNSLRTNGRNGAHRRSLVLLALCGAVAFACQGPTEPAPLRRPPEPSASPDGGGAETQAQRASQRAAERELDELRRLVEIDRRACETAEQTVANLRSLHSAGRVSDAELGVAEADLLRLLHALRLREQDLADAQRARPPRK
jgi:outer membrane protein TolC